MYVWYYLRIWAVVYGYAAKYDNSYFFCSRYFWFLVFARQPAKYNIENRYKPTRRRDSIVRKVKEAKVLISPN